MGISGHWNLEIRESSWSQCFGVAGRGDSK